MKWLKKKKHSAFLIHAGLKYRSALVNEFQEAINSDEDGDQRKKPKKQKRIKGAEEKRQARDARILVSTAQLSM